MELYELSGVFCPPDRCGGVRRDQWHGRPGQCAAQESLTRARMLVHIAGRIANITAQTHTLFGRQASRLAHTLARHHRTGPIDITMIGHPGVRHDTDITNIPAAGAIHHAATRAITRRRDGYRRRQCGRRHAACALATRRSRGLGSPGGHDHAPARTTGLIATSEIGGLQNRTR